MTVELDHILVPSRDMNASARMLAEILGVRWEPSGQGQAKPSAVVSWISGELSQAASQEYRAQRASVYVNDSLTLDFVNWSLLRSAGAGASDQLPTNHYCFRVSEADFDGIVERIRKSGLEFSSNGIGAPDHKINTRLGGKGVYFTQPDGHGWEVLTVSYARARK